MGLGLRDRLEESYNFEMWLKMRVGIARICGERLHLSGCACAWMVKMTAYDRGHSNSFQWLA